jgi:hypothetical protein
MFVLHYGKYPARISLSFICDLFKDAVSSSYYTASNGGMISQVMNAKGEGGSGRGLFSRHLAGRNEESHENVAG